MIEGAIGAIVPPQDRSAWVEELAVNMLPLMFVQTLNFFIVLTAIISKSVVHNYS
jgi:hypothetical protein